MRIEQKENTLAINQTLVEAARMKAEDMATKGYFAHTSPDGVTPWYWLDTAGYAYSYAGENLAINFVNSEDVVDAWMNSTGHRANILNKYFSEIGVGVAKGTYEGEEAIFVVQLLGRQVPKVISDVISSPKPTLKPTLKPTVKPSPIISSTPIPTVPVDNFVAIKGSESLEDLIELDINVDNVSENVSKALVLEEFFVNPKMAMLYIYVLLGLLVLVVILLSILIKIEVQYPKLILNGFLILFLIAGLALINQFLILSPVQLV
jgi:hypothetical protein